MNAVMEEEDGENQGWEQMGTEEHRGSLEAEDEFNYFLNCNL